MLGAEVQGKRDWRGTTSECSTLCPLVCACRVRRRATLEGAAGSREPTVILDLAKEPAGL